MSRKIQIYTGAGQGTREFETSSNTWGDLKSELTSAGVSLNNTTAVVGETEVTLESSGAMLPQTPFTLFLLPSKVKSGTHEGSASSLSMEELADKLAEKLGLGELQRAVSLYPEPEINSSDEAYEESYEESYDDDNDSSPRTDDDFLPGIGGLPVRIEIPSESKGSTPDLKVLTEAQTIMIKIAAAKDLLRDIEVYFANQNSVLVSPVEETEMDKQARELMNNLFN